MTTVAAAAGVATPVGPIAAAVAVAGVTIAPAAKAAAGATTGAAAGGTTVRAATTAAVAGGMTGPVVTTVAAVGATTAPAAKAAAGATTGAATGVATTVEMTAAVAIEPTAVRAATIAPPTAAASRTGAARTRAAGATTTAEVGPAGSTAATLSLGAGATRATPGMTGGVGTPTAIDRAAVIGPDRRTTVAAATTIGAARVRMDHDAGPPGLVTATGVGHTTGQAARRDGTTGPARAPRRSADGARTGDVREGRWSDTWSDRRRRDDRSGGEGQGSRERQTTPAPPLSDAIAASALDPAARRDLLGLQKDVAEAVARHLVAAGTLVDEDPEAALAHARYARRRASRIAVVREAAGITAYHAGEWAEALAELRAARRMGGGPGHLAVMADIERAMGRPERAIELARSPEARELDRNAQIELAIVVAGARRDLDEIDAAVVALQVPELEASRRDPWSARLFYAYADNLLAAGRESDALQWFVHAADADTEVRPTPTPASPISPASRWPTTASSSGSTTRPPATTPPPPPPPAPTSPAEDADTTADTTPTPRPTRRPGSRRTRRPTEAARRRLLRRTTRPSHRPIRHLVPRPMTPTPRPTSRPRSRRTRRPTRRPRWLMRTRTWPTTRPARRRCRDTRRRPRAGRAGS